MLGEEISEMKKARGAKSFNARETGQGEVCRRASSRDREVGNLFVTGRAGRFRAADGGSRCEDCRVAGRGYRRMDFRLPIVPDDVDVMSTTPEGHGVDVVSDRAFARTI